MSSPAGLRYFQTDFLARWMPSSSRAGVILNPCPDLAASLRYTSPVGVPASPRLEPDVSDSFASDFAPLPASADSSCLGVHELPNSLGETAAVGRLLKDLYSAPPGDAYGELDSLDEMASKSQEPPLMVKLDQLRKWQQHMQEQLKDHQLVELLHLQEEQQRLLAVMNGRKHKTEVLGDLPDHTEHTESPGLSGAERLCGASNPRESSYSPTMNSHVVPNGSNSEPHIEKELTRTRRQEWLQSGQNREEVHDEDESIWSTGEDDQEQSTDLHEHDAMFKPCSGASLTEDSSRKKDSVLKDRPIKPGIGGQMKTFEELLEEQLRLEEQRLKSDQKQKSLDGVEAVQACPKRAFLKRGEGLLRFTNNHSKASLPKKEMTKDPKPQTQARVMSRSNSEPAAIQKGGTNGNQRLPVQRKTAILNKKNILRRSSCSPPPPPPPPPQNIRVESKPAWMKILSGRQRQNTAAESIQTDADGRQTNEYLFGQVKEQSNRKVCLPVQTLGRSDCDTQPNHVTKQIVTIVEQGKAENDATREQSCGSREELPEGRTESEGGDGVPQDSFELSYQERLHQWESNRQLESMELGEFELLEQAVEELSFSSNSSFVMKVLQMDQQRCRLQGAEGLHQRRLSSTPIKSLPRGENQRCSCGVVAGKSSSANSQRFVAKIGDDAMTDKVCIEDAGKRDSEKEEKDVSSSCGSEIEPHQVSQQEPRFPSTICFPAQSNPPYNKRCYQDEYSCRDSASDVMPGEDEAGDSILNNTDDSTLIEDREDQQGGVVFDDNDTWNDLEDTAVSTATDGRGGNRVSKETADGSSEPESTMLKKVAVSKIVDSSASQEPDPPPSPPPPASQLMTRLFPSLNPKNQNAPPPPAVTSAVSESIKAKEKSGQQVQSILLRERLAELEIEIERFKKENATLAKLRQENEKTQDNLRRERLEFEQMKAEELAKFEEYKKEESRKLQKERKLFEKHAAAARAIPDKKEREEIQELKQQLSSLQEETRKKESRWSSSNSRLRQQIDSLSQENNSLQEEVRMFEKLRLSALKKNSVDAEKDRDMRDTSSVTKGVKFASPLDSRGGSSSPPQSSTTAATRGSSRESGQPAAAVGMKSSLRRPAAPGGSSSSSVSRRMEERSEPDRKLPNQEHSQSCSSKLDTLPNEPECNKTKELESVQEVITHADGKIEKVLAGGNRLITFPNGTRKEVSANGLTVKVTFFNGDTKEITADQRVIYHYADAKTTHITYPDGLEVLHFPNNQTEKHFPDGRKEIIFSDQTVKNLFPNGSEESVLTDGTIIQVNPDGTKEILFNTGQKEVHTSDYKRREYPDGTVKTVYNDGRQETRYPTGRLRIKDKDGNVVADGRA